MFCVGFWGSVGVVRFVFGPGGVNASRHIECNENTFDLDGDAANGCEVDWMGWMNSGQISSRPKTGPKTPKGSVFKGESQAISANSKFGEDIIPFGQMNGIGWGWDTLTPWN